MHLRSLALVAALAIAPFAAQASTVAYSATGSGFVETFGPSEFDIGFFDDLSGDTNIDAGGTFTSGNIAGEFLIVSDDTGIVLESEKVLSFDLGTDILTVIFGDLDRSGSAIDLFDTTATAIFRFDAASANNGSFEFVSVDILSDIAPVPLPASLPLLLAGLGAIAAVRRRRT